MRRMGISGTGRSAPEDGARAAADRAPDARPGSRSSGGGGDDNDDEENDGDADCEVHPRGGEGFLRATRHRASGTRARLPWHRYCRVQTATGCRQRHQDVSTSFWDYFMFSLGVCVCVYWETISLQSCNKKQFLLRMRCYCLNYGQFIRIMRKMYLCSCRCMHGSKIFYYKHRSFIV